MKRLRVGAGVVLVLVIAVGVGGFISMNDKEKGKDKEKEKDYYIFTGISEEAKIGYESLKRSNSSSRTMTRGESNALRTAHNYLKYTAFSKKGLIDQLEYEGYSTSEAKYAVEKIDMDWKIQAGIKAVQYLKYMPMSKSQLEDQLVFDGFTYSEASYGARIAYK